MRHRAADHELPSGKRVGPQPAGGPGTRCPGPCSVVEGVFKSPANTVWPRPDDFRPGPCCWYVTHSPGPAWLRLRGVTDVVRESGAVAEGAPAQVLAPSSEGGRPVVLGSVVLGVAYGAAAVVDILRQAGIEDSVIALDDGKLIEWQGGGPEARDRPPGTPAGRCASGLVWVGQLGHLSAGALQARRLPRCRPRPRHRRALARPDHRRASRHLRRTLSAPCAVRPPGPTNATEPSTGRVGCWKTLTC